MTESCNFIFPLCYGKEVYLFCAAMSLRSNHGSYEVKLAVK